MRIVHDETACQFVMLAEDGTRMGEIEYENRDGVLYATHTQVLPLYEGQGHAARLLDALAAYAESKGVKIVPVCSYVVSAFRRYPEKYAAVM